MEEFISMQHINKSYGNQIILNDLSLEIPYNTVTALLGASGSGKTTLLRILLELEKPDSGTITGLSNLKKSAVFQEDRLCENLTSLANIQLTAVNTDKSMIINTMEQINLLDCWKKPVRELSGGMKRRIAILRALLADYQFLILDEPFKGLDEHTKTIVIKTIKHFTIDKTVILVTHDKTELSLMGAAKIITL